MSLDPRYSPQAAEQLDRLAADPATGSLYDAVCDAIDLICDHPRSAEARRESLRTQAGNTVWRVPVRYFRDEESWLLLWQPLGEEALIACIGTM